MGGAIMTLMSPHERGCPLPEWRPMSPICPNNPCRINLDAICKIGRKKTFSFDADFQIESYLRHQGMTFVDRFDANSYLYVTRAMDYYDLAADYEGQMAKAFMGTKTRFCLVSFTSDWHFPTSESRKIVHALNAAGASVSFVEIDSDKGHDAFLLDEPEFFDAMRGFLGSAARDFGLLEPQSGKEDKEGES